MPLRLMRDEATGVFELRVSGILKRAEYAEAESSFAAAAGSDENLRVLTVMEHFAGWEPSEDWNNLDFMFSHGSRIAKIAIVGAGSKEDDVRIFSGAGIRSTAIEFFAAGDESRAREWLME